MKLYEILDNVRNTTGWYLQNSWSKDYGNGTTLCEYKLFERKRQRKPIAFVQVGYYNDNKEVIGATMFKGGETIELI